MTNDTTHRDLRAILADLDCPPSPHGTGDEYYRELELAVRAQLAPLPAGEAEAMAAAAERAARTMAPPVPGVTRNAGYTIRDVIYANPAGGGLLESWWVTGEAGDGRWVTWLAYAQDGTQAGQLAYTWGHYDGLDSHATALRDLADRAGIITTAS